MERKEGEKFDLRKTRSRRLLVVSELSEANIAEQTAALKQPQISLNLEVLLNSH
ncbi:hypothetical protein BVRB_4g092530 [Beta vulgaris subsp. vulgaris]|nr:hypothetical protein BVRB_4g092530 [Beta vulgaris subsp. vulgaris]